MRGGTFHWVAVFILSMVNSAGSIPKLCLSFKNCTLFDTEFEVSIDYPISKIPTSTLAYPQADYTQTTLMAPSATSSTIDYSSADIMDTTSTSLNHLALDQAYAKANQSSAENPVSGNPAVSEVSGKGNVTPVWDTVSKAISESSLPTLLLGLFVLIVIVDLVRLAVSRGD